MASLEIVIKQAVKEQVEAIVDSPEFKKETNKIFANACDPYVPYDTGALAKNITVNETGITYNQPYASEVYDSANVHNTNVHPLASSRWDEVAFANHKDEIGEKVKENLNRWIKTKR